MRHAPGLLASLALLGCALFQAGSARAEREPLPAHLIALDSIEGQRIFAHAKAKADYWRLAESYVEQKEQSFCPVASSVMVLNALDLAAPEVKAWAPYRRFTQDNL